MKDGVSVTWHRCWEGTVTRSRSMMNCRMSPSIRSAFGDKAVGGGVLFTGRLYQFPYRPATVYAGGHLRQFVKVALQVCLAHVLQGGTAGGSTISPLK